MRRRERTRQLTTISGATCSDADSFPMHALRCLQLAMSVAGATDRWK